MTLLVGTLAVRKGLFSSSIGEYPPMTVEFSDSAAAVSRRDSISHKVKKGKKTKKGKAKESGNQSRRGQSRDILDEEPLR